MASYYKFSLKANQAIQVPISGKVILVDDLGGAPGLDITPIYQGAAGITMPKRQTAFKAWVDYDAVTLSASVDCTVALFLSMSDVTLGFTNGSSINVQGQVTVANGAGARVPVDIGGGAVNVTASNVTIGNTAAQPIPVAAVPQGTTLGHVNPVAINTGAAQLALAGTATRRSARFRNASTNGANIALGGAGVTMANAVIILAPGEVWDETNAAAADWYATSDINGASVAAMGASA